MHLQNNYAVTEDRKAVAGKQKKAAAKQKKSCRKTAPNAIVRYICSSFVNTGNLMPDILLEYLLLPRSLRQIFSDFPF